MTALIVLLGWAFRVFPFIAVLPGLQTMKPNTAASFLLVGLALVRRRHRDSVVYSLGVLAVGASALFEYLLGYDFDIDQLLLRDPYSAINPGRMSEITSVGFTLLGPALVLVNAQSEGARRISRILASLAGTLGVIAVLGYSYDTQALYKVRPYSSVALHTAIAFVITAIGVNCANPAEGLVGRIRADNAGGAMLRQLLPVALLIPYLLGFTAWIAHKHFGWDAGFSLALVIAATMLCLAVAMLLNAKRLERNDQSLRETYSVLKHRTALLEAQTDLLNIFVKQAPVSVAMLDRNMRYLEASDRWCSDYSLDSLQIKGRSHYEVFPDLPERWKDIHRRGLAGETVRAEEDCWDRAERGTT